MLTILRVSLREAKDSREVNFAPRFSLQSGKVPEPEALRAVDGEPIITSPDGFEAEVEA